MTLPGAPQHHPPPDRPCFFSHSPLPGIPVWIGEWRLLHEALVEQQSISYIWRISRMGLAGEQNKALRVGPPPPDTRSRSPSLSIQWALLPTHSVEDIHSSLAAMLLLLSLFISCTSLSLSPNRDASQTEGSWFKAHVVSPPLCHIYFPQLLHCDLCNIQGSFKILAWNWLRGNETMFKCQYHEVGRSVINLLGGVCGGHKVTALALSTAG